MKSFPPLVGNNPRVLILGSMPSRISLRETQYYGNPHNTFWWILSQILQFPSKLDYDGRLNLIRQSSFSVWDVLSECQRPGSLDSNIVRSSEVPNDIGGFLERNQSIVLIAFNGGAAKAIFQRHFKGLLSADALYVRQLETIQLPSTSPAYAGMNKDEKLRRWKDAMAGFI